MEDAKVVLKLVIKAGKQYRIKDITFVGLSTQVAQADLRHAFDIQTGDIADGNKITLGMHNLQILFQRKGEDVYVVPGLVFDDPASTISFRFDIRK